MNKGELLFQQIEKPLETRGEAILKVKKAGICGTDIAIASGDYKIKPLVVLGHEIFGVIDSISRASKLFSIGTRVATEINVSCGNCDLCKIGLKNHCLNIRTIGIDRDGGFADFVSTPIENLHVIPDSITDEEAVFVEPLAAAIELTKMSSISKQSTIAVIGIGRLGLLILQVLKLKNPKLLVAITRHKGYGKRSKLATSFGANEILSSTDEIQSLSKITKGIGFDHVIEATGNPAGIDLALEIVRPRGTIHVKSTHGLPVNLDITKVAVKEVRIQGSRCGPFEEAIGMLQDKLIKTKELITARFALDEFRIAFAEAKSPSQIKVIFDF
ncbi:MAG: alcohol dehydrogenase catalytic domain-containing protein [archaeon]|nr:alcohol dehydrogenase catalytic domain-containing protein [archaeon]